MSDERTLPPEPERVRDGDLGNYLQMGLQILQLEPEAIRSASRDEDALLPAFLFCASAGVAAGAG